MRWQEQRLLPVSVKISSLTDEKEKRKSFSLRVRLFPGPLHRPRRFCHRFFLPFQRRSMREVLPFCEPERIRSTFRDADMSMCRGRNCYCHKPLSSLLFNSFLHIHCNTKTVYFCSGFQELFSCPVLSYGRKKQILVKSKVVFEENPKYRPGIIQSERCGNFKVCFRKTSNGPFSS